jgi:hypothetical protein
VSAVVNLLLWVSVVLVVALAALLLMPVRVSAAVQTAPQLTYQVDVRLLGHWTPRIPLLDSARPRKPDGKAREKRAPHRVAQPVSGKKTAVRKRRLSRECGARMVPALPRLLAEVARSVQWESFHLDAEFGLGDPADTGQMYGCITPLQYGVPWPPSVSIALRPNFERVCLGGELQATLRLRLAALLAPAARFAWRAFGPQP